MGQGLQGVQVTASIKFINSNQFTMNNYTLEYQQTTAKESYGVLNVYTEYTLITLTDGVSNSYEVKFRVSGLQDGHPYLSIVKCFALDDNRETLNIDGVTDIIEENNLIS